jgi:hypothetical protein
MLNILLSLRHRRPMDRRVRIGRVLPLMAITGWLRISETHTLHCRHGLGVRNDRSERAVFVRARELGRVLKHELRGQREWDVYVEGDDCVAWANVVDVLDIAHSNGAKVFLVPQPNRKPGKAYFGTRPPRI